MAQSLPRRDFLTGASVAAGSLALGGFTGTARGFAKNETIHIGVIGAGGRARGALMPALKKFPGVKITAVCDVFDDHAHAGKFIAGGKDGNVFTTRHHEELLSRSDVDAVVIATSDNWHVPLTIDACAAGKDVYVEKPLTHNLAEGQAVIDAQNRHKRIVQVGMQQRSMPQFAEARELVKAGKLGTIHRVHMSWNRNSRGGYGRRVPVNIPIEKVDWKRFCGNAPEQPYDPYVMRNWRWFWDFGGGLFTDLMVHWLDAVNMVLGLAAPPDAAASFGHHIAPDCAWQTPETAQTLLSYTEPKMHMHFESTFSSAHNRAGVTIMGTDAALYLDRGRIELIPEPNAPVEAMSKILGDGPKGADFYKTPDGEAVHLANWLECIRTRQTPTAPAEAGVLSAAGAHLANMSLKQGQMVRRG